MVRRLRVPQARSSRSAGVGARTPAASGPPRWSTRWAGRSTASACSTSAPARSCSCCSATWAGPAAGSWRCAATPASRARPTSRRCSTSCPATCRCPTRPTTDLQRGSTASGHRAEGLLEPTPDAYTVSLLKAYWGEAATAENDYCFDYLPKLTGDHGTYRTVLDMIDGKVKGYFLLGQNPAVGSATASSSGSAWPTSTGWWSATCTRSRARPSGRTRRRSRPARSCPRSAAPRCSSAGGLARGEGRHVHQTQRMLQWRDKALDPPGDCRSELWFFYHLGRMVKERLAGSTDPRDRPLLDLAWDYPVHGRARRAERRRRAAGDQRLRGRDRPAAVDVHRAEGRRLDRRRLLDLHRRLRRRRQPGGAAQARQEQSGVAPEWGWVWPANRRILYNRASADPDGQAVERAEGLRLVGRGAGRRVDRARRARLREDQAAVVPPARGRERHRGASPATTRSSCRPTARAGFTSRRA